MSGLTITGFQAKRLAEIKTEIEQRLRDELGASINLQPSSVFGTMVGIFAEREALLWQLAENVYNASYPDTAEGTSLDNVVAITGITRLAATKSTLSALYLKGTIGTLVPAGTIVSVDGNPDATFVTDANVTLVAGADEVQDVTFSGTPTSGSFRLVYEDEQTGLIAWNDNAATVQSELNALNDLSGVTVSGSFAAGFTITFAGDDGKLPQPLLTTADNSLDDGGAVTISVAETVAGVPQGTASVTAENAGEVQALARTLTVIDTPVSGLDSVINLLDATEGRDTESDLELRIRRAASLQVAGAATLEAIRSALQNVADVTAVTVIENDTDVTDGDGRPPHSFEAVVLGGANQNIADEIFKSKAAGITSFGSVTETVTDSQGISHSISFSRPTEVDIYVTINLTVNAEYPVDGDDLVEAALLAEGNSLGIGENVIVSPDLLCAIDGIDGITNAVIFAGTSPAPSTQTPISIGVDEIAAFDSSRIVVNS